MRIFIGHIHHKHHLHGHHKHHHKHNHKHHNSNLETLKEELKNMELKEHSAGKIKRRKIII